MAEPLSYSSLGTPFIELLSVDSTNNYALSQTHAGLAQHGMAIFAHEQSAGKGQRGKSWTAPKDSSIILSVLIDPRSLQLTQQFQLSACISLSVCEFFKKYAGNDVRIKWPNDLYWGDRKAGGILIENIIGGRKREVGSHESGVRSQEAGAGRRESEELLTSDTDLPNTSWLWAVAGIGININQAFFPDEIKNPVSLKQITGKSFDIVDLAKELCSVLDKNFKKLISEGFGDIYASYLSNLYKLNEPVTLKKANRSFKAVIKSITPMGELVVEHGIEERFGFGEIEWVVTTGKSKK